MPDSQRYPQNVCVIKHENDLNVYAKVTCSLTAGKHVEIIRNTETFKTDNSFQIVNQKGFYGTIARRVT